MSIQATDNETLIGSSKPSSSFRVPNIPLHNEEDDTPTVTSTSRVPNIPLKKKKDDALDLGILGGVISSSLSSITSVSFDENTQQQISTFTDKVRTVGTVLGTASVATFAFSATVAAMGLKGDGLKPKKTTAPDAPNKLAKTIAEEGTEATAKPVAKILVEEGAEIAAKGFLKSLGSVAKAVGGLLKRMTGIGFFITGGFVAYEVGSLALRGQWANAGAATVAGGAEMVGNIVGFGAGDALREGVRGAFIVAGGDSFEAVAKSDIRAVAEMGIDMVGNFNASAAAPVVAQAPIYNRGFVPAAFAA